MRRSTVAIAQALAALALGCSEPPAPAAPRDAATDLRGDDAASDTGAPLADASDVHSQDDDVPHDLDAPDVSDAPDAPDAPDANDASDAADVTDANDAGAGRVRLVAPLSGAVWGGDRPAFRWAPSDPARPTTLQLCADRVCTRPVGEQTFTGGSARWPVALAAGRYHWRARQGDGPYTATWRFAVRPGTRPREGGVVGALGDIDGDNYDDLTVLWNVAGYLGDATPLALRSGVGLQELHGAPGGFGLRRWVPIPNGSVPTPPTAPVGDLDGDGFPDQITGLRERPEVARIEALRGTSFGLYSTTVQYMLPTFYAQILPAGDFDGDGYGDVLLTINYMIASGGGAYWVPGSATGARAPERFVVPNVTRAGMITGSSTAADFNGDGYGDAVVCGTEGDPCRLFAGGPSWPPSGPSLEIPPANGHDGFGARAQAVGDVNGDGYADLMIVALETMRPNLTSLYFGGASGLRATADRTLEDCSGCVPPPLVGVGDITGDGVDDLARGDDFLHVEVFRGGPDVLRGEPMTLTLTGTPLPIRRDFDGDGRADLVLRRDSDDAQSTYEVYLSTADGFRMVASFTFGAAATSPAPFDVGARRVRSRVRLASRARGAA